MMMPDFRKQQRPGGNGEKDAAKWQRPGPRHLSAIKRRRCLRRRGIRKAASPPRMRLNIRTLFGYQRQLGAATVAKGSGSGGRPGLSLLSLQRESSKGREFAMATKIRFSNPVTIGKPPGYTHVVEIAGPGRIVYFAGQLGFDLDNNLVGGPGDFRAQATQAFENMRLALKSVGGTFNDVIKINNYLTDMSHIGLFREVRDQFVNTAAPPASTTIAISQLAKPGALFEIEARSPCSGRKRRRNPARPRAPGRRPRPRGRSAKAGTRSVR